MDFLIGVATTQTPVPDARATEMATTQTAAVVVLAVRLNSMRSVRYFKHILTLCCLVVLVSCGGEKNDALIDPRYVVETGEVKLSELVDSMRFIPLETNDECLIGQIRRIKHRNGRFFVQADDRLMVFDEEGRFERVVTKIGEGPDEVISILDYDVADNNNIAVSSGSGITIFDADSVINKAPIEPASIRRTSNGWLAVTSPLQNGNKMVAFDENWDTVGTAMATADFDGWNPDMDLIPLSDHTYFHQICMGNELFEYDSESGATRQYKIIDSPYVMTPQEYADYNGNLMECPKHIIRYITANRDQILLGVIENRAIFYYIYDKKDHSVAQINVFKITDDISGVELENNSLLGAMYSNDSDDAYFVSYLFGTPEMNAKFVPDFNSSMVEYMDDETNPILVLTKFKTPSEMK